MERASERIAEEKRQKITTNICFIPFYIFFYFFLSFSLSILRYSSFTHSDYPIENDVMFAQWTKVSEKKGAYVL